MVGSQHLGRLMQMASAAIVAHSRPVAQHELFRGCGQCSYGRKRPNEWLVIAKDGGHLSLLEHDFADPDSVRVAILAPRQIPSMAIKPAEKIPADFQSASGAC